jgi:glucose-1-phosphate cytidylyltransferase
MAFRHTGFWRAVDTFKDRAELDDLYRREEAPWMLWDQRRGPKDAAPPPEPGPPPASAISVSAGGAMVSG